MAWSSILRAFPFLICDSSRGQDALEERQADVSLMWVWDRKFVVTALHELVLSACVRTIIPTGTQATNQDIAFDRTQAWHQAGFPTSIVSPSITGSGV